MSLAKVAEKAGVSTATVCRVLRNASLVRPETANQVLEAMQELGFVPPPPRAARRRRVDDLGNGSEEIDADPKAQRIAVITIGERHKHWLTFHVIASFFASLTAAARDLDADVLLDEMPDPLKLSRLVRRGEIGGAIVLVRSELARTQEGMRALERLAGELPVVWAMGAHSGPLVVDHVTPDNLGVGHLAASHLSASGARRLAFVTTTPTWPLVRARAAGFANAAHDVGAELMTYLISDDRRNGNTFSGQVSVVGSVAEAAAAIAQQRPDGLFAATDGDMALLHPQLAQAGLRPDQDIRLISCDNDPGYLGLMSPPPTTIDLNTAEVAQRSIRRLRMRIRHPSESPVLIQVPPLLVEPSSHIVQPV